MKKFPYTLWTNKTVNEDYAPRARGFKLDFGDTFLAIVQHCQDFLKSGQVTISSVELYHNNLDEHVGAEFFLSDEKTWLPFSLKYLVHSNGVEFFDRRWGNEGNNLLFAEFGNDDLEAAKRQGVYRVMSADVDEDEDEDE